MSQSILVTAGASGIGRAIADRFLKAGDRVHVCDINQSLLDGYALEHNQLSTSLCDVGDPEQVQEMFAYIEKEIGCIDVLVNNAGIGGPSVPLECVGLDDWQQSLRVNLTGPFLTMKQVIPGMKRQKSGCIINIVTSSANTGLPNRTPYVASKCGLRGLTHNAARELGPYNIRVNGVFPGVVDNPRGRALIANQAKENGISEEDAKNEFLSYVSMRTMVDPSDIADMCHFLASAAARHVTGQEISVDGNVEWEQ